MRTEPRPMLSDTDSARLREYIFRRWDGAFKAMAEGDKRPAKTDSCRAPDGTCDGSCTAAP